LEEVQDLARALGLDVLRGLDRIEPGPRLDTGERFGYLLVDLPAPGEEAGRGGGRGGQGSRRANPALVLDRTVDVEWLDEAIEDARQRALARDARDAGLSKKRRRSTQPALPLAPVPLESLPSLPRDKEVHLECLVPHVAVTPGEGVTVTAALLRHLPRVVPVLAQRHGRKLGSLLPDGNCLFRGLAKADFVNTSHQVSHTLVADE
jgi:hypothetical protein